MKVIDRTTLDLDEIKVTPEMVDAGYRVLEEYYLGLDVYDLGPPCLEEVYRAMVTTGMETQN